MLPLTTWTPVSCFDDGAERTFVAWLVPHHSILAHFVQDRLRTAASEDVLEEGAHCRVYAVSIPKGRQSLCIQRLADQYLDV